MVQQSHDGRGPLCREHLSPIASRIAAVVSVLAVETGEPGLLSTGLPTAWLHTTRPHPSVMQAWWAATIWERVKTSPMHGPLGAHKD